MTKDETKKILMIMEATYANYHPADKGAALMAWSAVLSDVPYELVQAALTAYIRTNRSGFAPDPGQIMGQIEAMRNVQRPSAAQAWDAVERAMRRSSYYAAEEFAKLDEISQKCIGSPAALREMAISSDTPIGVFKGQFLKAYEAESNRGAWLNALPEKTREALTAAATPLLEAET